MIYFFEGFYYEKREEEIIQNSYVLREYIRDSFTSQQYNELYQWLELTANINSGQAWVIDKNGYHVMSYPSIIEGGRDEIRFLEFNQVLAGEIVARRVDAVYFERPMLLVGVPIVYNGQVEGALLIFTSVAGINSTIQQVQRMMVFSSLLAAILAMLIAYRWSKSLSNPLKKMSDVAIELSKGNFDEKIDIKEKGEIATLIDSMNYLSNKLEQTIQNLTEERNKLKYILTGMEEGVLVINLKEDIVLINDSAKKLLKLERNNKIVDCNFHNLVDSEKIKEVFMASKKEDDIVSNEFSIELEGYKHRILLSCTPIHIENKKFWGVVGLFKDISERWRFEKLQQDFVTNVSHELKTPLTSIKGSTELLLDGVVKDEKTKNNYLKMILEETNRLSDLVNEILNLSEIDSELLKIKKEKVSVNKLLEDVKLIFNKSNIRAEREFVVKDLAEDSFIYGNYEKLKQVILNLLDNACKFSDLDSKITLEARLIDKAINISVKDEGIGISEEDQKNIWERFYKADKAHTPDKSGSGLGLSIVKQIILDHQGEVFVKSTVGEGSTFGFRIDKYQEK